MLSDVELNEVSIIAMGIAATFCITAFCKVFSDCTREYGEQGNPPDIQPLIVPNPQNLEPGDELINGRVEIIVTDNHITFPGA